MLEHCGITFSWGTEFGKGGPILAAKIGPGGLFLAADRFFRYRTEFPRKMCPPGHIFLADRFSSDTGFKKRLCTDHNCAL